MRIEKKGTALISVLALMAVSLVIISSVTLVSILNGQMGLTRIQASNLSSASSSLLEEAILRFCRDPNFINPYPDWTNNCLQIPNFVCKMEIETQDTGGLIDVYGKMAGKIRHLQVVITIEDDGKIIINSKKEIY